MVLISHTKERVINVNKEKLIVIIPAYEPPREFVQYAATVASLAGGLVVVNDGSSAEYDDIFREISEKEYNIILRHMWPLTVIPPKYKEGWIVTFSDKYCAFLEVLYSTNKKYKTKFLKDIGK